MENIITTILVGMGCYRGVIQMNTTKTIPHTKVAVYLKCGGMSMTYLDAKQQPLEILIDKNVSFRLKSKTIMLNGIGVPKPFVPKIGETYWCFSTQTVLGYGHNVYVSDYDDKRFINMGVWRTEGEIKQVIAALRSVFKTD